MNESENPLPEEIEEDFRHEPEASTLVFKRTHLYAVLLPLAFVIGLSVGYLFWGRASALVAAPKVAAQPQQSQPVEQTQQEAVQRYEISEDDDPSIGPSDAPITIVEFSDYECPYCRRWHLEVFDRIREEYPDQVRFVFRDFPLTSIHPNAVSAAEAANCSNEQDAYWEYQERLFSGDYELSQDGYLLIAGDLGLDEGDFESCLASGRYSEEVQADLSYASNLGVRSTPTFFLNGLPIVGAQPFDVFKEVIEKELAGEIP